MYLVRFIFLIVFILAWTLPPAMSQGSWEKLDLPSQQHLRSVYFTDSLYGWICGDSGTLLHTNDGGESWESINSGSKNDDANAYGRLAKFTYDYGDGGTVSNYLEVGTTGSGRRAPGNRKYRSLIPLYDSSGNINEVLLWNSAHTQNVTQKVTLSNLSHSTVSYDNNLNVIIVEQYCNTSILKDQ